MVCAAKHQLFHNVAYILPRRNKREYFDLHLSEHFEHWRPLLSPEQSATLMHIEATSERRIGEQRIKQFHKWLTKSHKTKC